MIMRVFPIVSPVLFIIIVTILGFVTPGYNHVRHTISRLAIERYGIIQSLNMLQLALGIYVTGKRFTERIRDGSAVHGIRTIFTVSSVFLIIAAFFPTDPIENIPLDLSLLSPTGLVHVLVVIVFLLLSPLGIITLADILKRRSEFRPYVFYTLTAGFAAFLGSIVWFAFYFLGLYLEYRGIFQKLIALPVLIWLILINLEGKRGGPSAK